MHLVNGTGNSPSPGRPTLGVVKQDKSSGGSVDTTKTRSGPQRVRMSSGEGPIGAAKGKQSDTEALCQTPPLAGPVKGEMLLYPPPPKPAQLRTYPHPGNEQPQNTRKGSCGKACHKMSLSLEANSGL